VKVLEVFKMRRLQIKGITIDIDKWNWISNEHFKEAYSKMYDNFKITVPEFRRILTSFGLRFNWLNDLEYYLPVAIGDIVKFEKNAQDKYVGYEKNGKILLSSVTEPGFYKVTSIPRREPTFNQVFVRKEVYDLYPEMTYSDARKVFDKYGMRHCVVEGTTLFAWKYGYGFVAIATLTEDLKSFTSFRMIVPSKTECVMVGYDGKDSSDHYYNLARTARDAFLQTLLQEAEKNPEERLRGYVQIPTQVNVTELPDDLRELLSTTINFRKELQNA
jgi:hypothetical protein